MTKSKTSVSIALTNEQLHYVRELVAHDLTIGTELPDDDDSFDDMHDMARSVLESIDAPMPLYESELTQ